MPFLLLESLEKQLQLSRGDLSTCPSDWELNLQTYQGVRTGQHSDCHLVAHRMVPPTVLVYLHKPPCPTPFTQPFPAEAVTQPRKVLEQ